MARKKLIRAFDDTHYSVMEWEGCYTLYDKDIKGKETNSIYVGSFKLSQDNKRYVFNGNEYTDIESLVSAMWEYNKTLPFNHELYNPVYNESYRFQSFLVDYLTRIGLKYNRSNKYLHYTLNDIYDRGVVDIIVVVNDDTSGKVIQFFADTTKSMEIKFNDLDSAIAAINSMLAPYVMILCSNLIGLMSNITGDRTTESITKNTLDFNTLSLKTEDMRLKLIESMENEIEKLKEGGKDK
jgi:hypothetical protein